WAAGPGSVAGSRGDNREGSCAAGRARMVATPSRRLSTSARAELEMSASALMRARSWRTSSAITWNLTRFVGPTLPLTDLASTSRTRRARIGKMGAGSFLRDELRRLPAGADVVWPVGG